MIIFDVSVKRWNSPEFLLADMRILDVSPEEVLLFSHSHSLLFFSGCGLVIGVVAPLSNKVARSMSFSSPITV